jgi:hypothetical protein
MPEYNINTTKEEIIETEEIIHDLIIAGLILRPVQKLRNMYDETVAEWNELWDDWGWDGNLSD